MLRASAATARWFYSSVAISVSGNIRNSAHRLCVVPGIAAVSVLKCEVRRLNPIVLRDQVPHPGPRNEFLAREGCAEEQPDHDKRDGDLEEGKA